jgi:hypothetical protein
MFYKKKIFFLINLGSLSALFSSQPGSLKHYLEIDCSSRLFFNFVRFRASSRNILKGAFSGAFPLMSMLFLSNYKR